MLSALAVVLLVFAVSDGRIVSKCELKEELEEAQIQLIRTTGDKTTAGKLIARLVCNVENTSGFNTSLVTSIQISQEQIRPPPHNPPKPKEVKPHTNEDDDKKMEDEHIIPVHPIRSGPSIPEGKTSEIQRAKGLFWTWRRGLFPEKTPVESSGSGFKASSEEEGSGDSSEKSDDVIAWDLLGIFQLNDRVVCDSGSGRSLNLCGLECSALLDDDITDDIACLKTLVGSHGKFSGFTPKKRLLAQLLEMLPVKDCRSVLPSKYFTECP